MKKILFKRGAVVSSRGIKHADVLVAGDRIIAVGRHIKEDAEIIDVTGKLLFPGFIDAHTHFDLEVSDTVTADRFDTGTKSAIAGGVTTVVDFATQNKGETLSDALNNWHIKAFANSSCDYAFHMAISDWREDVKEELSAMHEQGVTSFKLYMTYPAMMLNDKEIFDVLTELKRLGCIAGCHCENAGIIDGLRERYAAGGMLSPLYHPQSRPSPCEAEAVDRFLRIAEAVDCPVIVVHLSSQEGLEEIRRARKRGAKVFVETCPQYLLLEDSVYDNDFDESAKYVCSPPIRKHSDRKALWRALKDGEIQTVSTDHCSFTKEQKRAGEYDFRLIPNGMPGVETRPILLYTYGVKKKRISLAQMCALLSENPAKLYGMYPKKGVIKAGADADIVVFDPHAHSVISAATQHSACGYTPYEGVKVCGEIENVYLRGELVYRDGVIVKERFGRYVSRGKPEL
ncbi:MAG: dihydropyrimidinase [Ruminococcus sp.]|nr:dihydropyrimidinase [Ruminococcus sp.]